LKLLEGADLDLTHALARNAVLAGELFQRFKKQNQASGSLGLGLSIVKKICTVYKLDVNYSLNKDLHTITISRTGN